MEGKTRKGTSQSAPKKKKNKKGKGGANDKCAEVKGGQLHTMFTSLVDVQSGVDFSELGEDDEFTWHKFRIKGWGARDFEGNAPVAMHNTTRRAVPLTWILLDSQSMVDLIANQKIMVNIRKVRDKDSIRVHCNSGVKIVDRVGDLPGYRNVWYELTGISNILSTSRVTNKFRVVFNIEGGVFPGWSSRTGR